MTFTWTVTEKWTCILPCCTTCKKQHFKWVRCLNTQYSSISRQTNLHLLRFLIWNLQLVSTLLYPLLLADDRENSFEMQLWDQDLYADSSVPPLVFSSAGVCGSVVCSAPEPCPDAPAAATAPPASALHHTSGGSGRSSTQTHAFIIYLMFSCRRHYMDSAILLRQTQGPVPSYI